MKVTVSSVLAAIILVATPALAVVDFTGVNEAGADFGSVGGVYSVNYEYPTDTSIAYFTKNKANVIRLPFLWERLQPTLNRTFDATELNRLKTVVNYATGVKGLCVLLDPHNYARYNGQLIGSSTVSYGNFYYFWKELAGQFKHNTKVIFGLMNEPNSMPTEQVLAAMQAGLDGVRAAGAKQLALVPGNAWTGAHSWTQTWYGTPNSVVMLKIKDPANNYAYDMHQYLDSDFSGTSPNCVSTTVGSEQLVAVTQWLKKNKKKAFLSEFGFGANPTCYAAGNDLLSYLHNNPEWIGWTYWAAGPLWGNYIFSVEPTLTGGDQPQMTKVLKHWLGIRNHGKARQPSHKHRKSI